MAWFAGGAWPKCIVGFVTQVVRVSDSEAKMSALEENVGTPGTGMQRFSLVECE